MSNPIPEKPDLNTDSDMSNEEKLEKLVEHFHTLRQQNEQMKQKLKMRREEKDTLRKRLQSEQQKNEVLKQPSLYIATIQEKIEEGERAPGLIFKQHGNNRQIVTEANKEVLSGVEVGDRVTIDDDYSVQQLLDTGSDERTQAMEVTESPNVTYSDIGGLREEMKEVREVVERPLEQKDEFSEVGIDPPQGVLLYGEPGTGKTMMAKAVANETDATFIRLAGSELVRKFIGEGAKLVRDLFELAQEEAPSIIFIDELDAIASERTVSKTSGDQEVQRTLMQLLSSMDGFEDRGDVRIIGATNRFDILDEAILRPGRFDRTIEVSSPDEEERKEIFKIHTRGMDISDDVDFTRLASSSEGFTGADISHTVTEAGMLAIRNGKDVVAKENFTDALERVKEDASDENNKIRYAY